MCGSSGTNEGFQDFLDFSGSLSSVSQPQWLRTPVKTRLIISTALKRVIVGCVKVFRVNNIFKIAVVVFVHFSLISIKTYIFLNNEGGLKTFYPFLLANSFGLAREPPTK